MVFLQNFNWREESSLLVLFTPCPKKPSYQPLYFASFVTLKFLEIWHTDPYKPTLIKQTECIAAHWEYEV